MKHIVLMICLCFLQVNSKNENIDIGGMPFNQSINPTSQSVLNSMQIQGNTYTNETVAEENVYTDNSEIQNLDSPVLISPLNYSTHISESPNLIWNSVANALSYTVQLSSNNSFINNKVDIIVYVPNKFVLKLPYSSIFYWRVRANNATENSAWSEVRSFTTKANPSTGNYLWAWGENIKYKCADANSSPITLPKQVQLESDWVSISCGFDKTFAIKTDGSLWSWGGSSQADAIPKKVNNDYDWSMVSAGYSHVLALKTDGSLWAWGQNVNGGLGDGTTTNRISPTRIGTEMDWACVAGGDKHSIALKNDGTMWAAGYNYYGELGNGTNISSNTFIKIGNDCNWADISCHYCSNLAIKTDGTLWSWGQNDNAQLGDGTSINRSIPVQIGSDNNWSEVAVGRYHTLATKTDGTLLAWGENGNGQHGDGTTQNRTIPTQIGSNNNWFKVAVGEYYSLAIKTDGTLWAWGQNNNGQLGDGSVVGKSNPTQIGNSNTWSNIGSNYNTSIALKSTGTPPIVAATPAVAYIIPDIGTPGMNTYMEIISNTNEFGAFGTDRTVINPYSDPNLKIEFFNPLDSTKISFGPLVVSWGGRMIATQVFVNPNIECINWNWSRLALQEPQNIIQFRVVNGANSSEWQKFYLVKPCPVPDLSNNLTSKVLGSDFGLRSPRGCMIVDSLNLNAINYSVSTDDCDPNTDGNQGYLPFVLLVKGNITGKTVETNTTTISLDAPSAPDAAPGGGGGGGKFCDFTGSGYNGGKGFVGGGPGGYNKAGNPFGGSDSYRDWGESSGSNGNSINGVLKPDKAWYENAGGGTGHPFGISGKGSFVQTPSEANNRGGYGGGSGDNQITKGGGAGNSTLGKGTNSFNAGKIHGNKLVVPIAGGSGGASGNPQGMNNCSGNGGGGGGAVRIFARDISSVNISAKGGNGSDGDGNTHGGGGSGGYVGVFAKNKANQVVANVTGGITNGLGTNGSGRVRFDAYEEPNLTHEPAAIDSAKYSGFTIDTTTYVRRNCIIKGTKQSSDILDIYLKAQSSGSWQNMGTISGSVSNWSLPLNLIGTDSVYYVLATKRISVSGRIDSVHYMPNNDFSQAAANILMIEKYPEIAGDSESEIQLDYCLGNKKYDTVKIWNNGQAALTIDMANARFRNNIQGFEFQPKTQKVLAPNDTLKISISYSVQAGVKGTLTDILEIPHNDFDAINNPWLVACTAIVDELDGEFWDDAKSKQIEILDFGDICPNSNRTRTASIRNISAGDVMLDFHLVIGTKFNPILSSKNIRKDGLLDFGVEFLGSSSIGLITDTLFLRLNGCADNLDTLILKANVIEPKIEFERTPLDLGIVCSGNKANNKTLEITNLTVLPLNLTYNILSPINGLTFSLSPNSILVANGKITATIGFDATGLPDDIYTWKIALNDANCGNFTDTIRVTAVVQTAIFEVVDLLDFNTVQVGFDNPKVIILKNIGTGTASINTIPIAKAPFEVLSSNPPVPTQIAPNGELILTVNFRPTAQGTFYDTLRFESIETGTTCSAIDSTILTGKASMPEVLVSPTEINFGLLATCQKKIERFTATNVGQFSVTIDKVEIIGTDQASYRIISPNGNTQITLQPNGGTQEYEVEYDASVPPIGIHNNAEVVFTASVEIPKVKLKAENESVNLTISPSSPIDLGAIPVGSTQNQTISITNNGKLPVSISSIVSSSTDYIVSPNNLDLNAGETKQISVTINATTVGDISYTIDYKITAPCPEDKQIVLSATGLEGKIEYNNLDFNVLASCETKLDSIIITNTGDADITINYSSIIDDGEGVFSLQNPITSAIVLKPEAIDIANSFYKLYVVFDPRNATDGIKTAKVLLQCMINAQNAEFKPQLRGERQSGLLLTPKELLFQNVRQNAVRMKSLNIKNIGQQIINITSIKLPTQNNIFRVTPQTMSIVMNLTDEINFSIEFAPTAIKSYSDTLTIYYRVQSCDDSVKIALSGAGVPATVVSIRLPKIYNIDPKSVQLDIPIYAKLENADDELPIKDLSISMQVAMNGTLFYPTGMNPNVHTFTNAIDATNKRAITIKLNEVEISKDEKIIGTIQGTPLLGNSIETELQLSNITHDNPTDVSEILSENGLLSYTICQSDGDRLIEYTEPLKMIINPYPPSDVINIEMTTLEQGKHILKIVNALGEEQVIESWNSDGKTNNSKTYSIPTDKYSSGAYLLILQGPSRMTTQQLQIIK